MAAQLGDVQVTRANSTTLTIGANCSTTNPCNVRFGALTYSITAASTVSLTAGGGNALIYFASSGVLTVGHTMTLTCSGTCQAQSGVIAFPTDSVPLFSWHATSATWDDTGTDYRTFLSSKNVVPGTGLVTTESSGHTTLAVDPTVIGMRTAPPASSTTSCTAGSWASDTSYYYICVSQDSWRRTSLNAW